MGGLGSPTNDAFFDPILDGLGRSDDRRVYEMYRFGADRGSSYRYDTLGPIDVNAMELRRLVADLSDECSAIDLVAHSMGGAVVDRAFSMGMSASDGVATYLPLSSPHNGALGARAVRLGVELDDTFAAVFGDIAHLTGVHDPTSDAVRDLASVRPPRPPRGVETVRQRLVTDLTVLRRDNVDRRYDVREYRVGSPPELEGHSGIVHNRHVQEVVAETIRAHAVPPDGRSGPEVKAASLASRLVDEYWAGIVGGAGLALGAVAAGSAIGGTARDAVREGARGDLAGAADATREGTMALASRVVAQAPKIAELAQAASVLREPFPATLLWTLFETVLE